MCELHGLLARRQVTSAIGRVMSDKKHRDAADERYHTMMSTPTQSTVTHIGQALRDWREQHQIPADDVADKLEIELNHLYIIERGEASPSLELRDAIRELGVDRPPLGELLRQQRECRSLSRWDLVDLFDVEYLTIIEWERGERRPTGDNWRQMVRWLNTTDPFRGPRN